MAAFLIGSPLPYPLEFRWVLAYILAGGAFVYLARTFYSLSQVSADEATQTI
jgi:hypothetical protein